jgi:hypothetical protein
MSWEMGANSGEGATAVVVVEVAVVVDGVVEDSEVAGGGCAGCPHDGAVATARSTAVTAPARATRDPDSVIR